MWRMRIFVCSAVALALIDMAFSVEVDLIDQMSRNEEVAHRLKQAIKAAKQMENGPLQEVVRTNFIHTLQSMATTSALAGTDTARAAGAIIRGFVQDSFNLGSVGAYLPRLIFLDGPSQFIETLRLIRTNQIRIPMDLDSAMDTLINFATMVRDAPVVNNVANPFLSIFPNLFRGSEKLAGDVLFNVFAWLAPLKPSDINPESHATFNNRWDSKSTTTPKPNV